jgi:ABC-2 type transport system permease protein
MASVNPGIKQTLLAGMVLFAFMCASLLTMPALLVTARESGVFRSYRINGVPAASILSIPAISTSVHMAVVSVLISVAGIVVYGAAAPTNVGGFVIAGLLGYLTYASISILIGVASSNNTLSTLICQLIYIPSIILGGITMPVAALPSGLQRVALLLPAAHCMRVFIGLGGPGSAGIPWLSITVLLSSILLSFLLSALLFEWDSRVTAPSKKAWLALLALAPYVVAVLIGG